VAIYPRDVYQSINNFVYCPFHRLQTASGTIKQRHPQAVITVQQNECGTQEETEKNKRELISKQANIQKNDIYQGNLTL
jgi:hypothetical protein